MCFFTPKDRIDRWFLRPMVLLEWLDMNCLHILQLWFRVDVDFTNSAPFKGVCLSVSLIDLAIPPPFKEVFLSVCWIDLPIAPPFNGVYLSVCCPLSGHCHLKLALSICSWRRNVWKKLSGVYSHPYFFHLPWRVPISSCECISHLGPDAVANRCSYHGSAVSRC